MVGVVPQKVTHSRLFWAAVVACMVVGVWLRSPSLRAGFHTDDAVQVAMVRGEFPAHRSIFDLFRFADGERDGLSVIESGYHPWWAQPNLRIAMFRPLASLLIAVDYWLFGGDAFYGHVHSLLWWVLMVGGAALVLKRVLTPATAAIALFLFAIHSSQSVPVAWLANRSTLIATTFGLFGLWLHLVNRAQPTRWRTVLVYIVFSLALFSGEYALPVLAYFFALELLDRDRPLMVRAKALLPALVPGAVVALLRVSFGFGIRGSGYYVSPLETPRAYVHGALERIPALLADLLAQIPAVWWVFGSPWFSFDDTRRFLLVVGLGSAALVCGALYLTRKIAPNPPTHIAWLTLGMILSVVPGSTALPENRVLVAAGFGSSALFAVLLVRFANLALTLLRSRRHALVVAPLALIAGIGYEHGYQSWVRTREQLEGFMVSAEVQRHWALSADIPDENAEQRRVIIISGADFTTIANLPWVRHLYGRPLVKSYWRLSGAVQVHELKRIDARTLEVSVLSNEIENTMAGSLYRSSRLGFHPGDVFSMPGLRVEVLGVDGKTPWLTRFTFARSLDDPEYLFLHSTQEGLKPFRPPAIGQKVRMSAPERPHF